MGILSRISGFFGRRPTRLPPSSGYTPISLPTPVAPSQPTSAPPTQVQPDEDEATKFLKSGSWLFVSSSNVHEWRYLWEDEVLEVEFLSGSIYQYYGVSMDTARDFFNTLSPGRFVWHILRAQGYDYTLLSGVSTKKTGRQKPNVIRPVGGYAPPAKS